MCQMTYRTVSTCSSSCSHTKANKHSVHLDIDDTSLHISITVTLCILCSYKCYKVTKRKIEIIQYMEQE